MITRSLTLAYAASLIVAVLIGAVSAIGLVFGPHGQNAADPARALGVTVSTGGVLVPGFVAYDTFNLCVALPVLVGVVWLARRGSGLALLLWPGALFYLLYTYAIYLVGAPFGPLFLANVSLVAVSGLTIIGLLTSVDAGTVSQRLADAVPARTVGGLVFALGLLTLAQDATGAIVTALDSGGQIEPLARRVWTADLELEVPALLAGGVLLWRRAPLGYVACAGLLLQFGMTPAALALILALQPLVSGAVFDAGAIVGVVVFAVVALVPIVLFAGPLRQPMGTKYRLKGTTP